MPTIAIGVLDAAMIWRFCCRSRSVSLSDARSASKTFSAGIVMRTSTELATGNA
jgi:hypothetical protein